MTSMFPKEKQIFNKIIIFDFLINSGLKIVNLLGNHLKLNTRTFLNNRIKHKSKGNRGKWEATRRFFRP